MIYNYLIMLFRKRYNFKKIICFIFCLGSFSVAGQSTSNYQFTTGTTGSLQLDKDGNAIDMSTGTTQLIGPNLTNVVSIIQNIGFTFYYMGLPYTQFSTNVSGQVQLGSLISGNSQSYTSLPKLILNNLACKTSATGKVHFKTQGVSPSSVLIIEWLNLILPATGTANTLPSTIQLRIYENGDGIEYIYGQMSNTSISSVTTNIGFNHGTSTGKIGQVTNITTVPAYNSTLTSVSSSSFTANSVMTNLNSASDGSRRYFQFAPPALIAPTNLQFTNIGITTMTLNWDDNSLNEIGYQIYRSTDNVNFNLVTTTAANAISSVQNGLSSFTTYYWRVATLTEGGISSFASSSDKTLACSLSGTKTIPGDYPSITAAVAALQMFGLSGPVILELQPGYTASTETFPITLNAPTCMSAINNVTIRPALGANVSISSINTTSTLDISGGSNWIIDGREGGIGNSSLTISNTSGFGTSAAVRIINNSDNNVLKYVTLIGTGGSTSNGVINFNTNSDNNLIDHCNIDGNAGTVASPTSNVCTVGINGGNSNINNTISNCNIYNNFSANVSFCQGIILSTGSSGWVITGNSFYQTALRYTNGVACEIQGIVLNSVTGTCTITNNFFGSTAPQCGFTAMALNGNISFAGIKGNSSNASVQGNTISKITISNLSSSTSNINIFYGIYFNSGSVNIGNLQGNYIGNTNADGLINLQGINLTTTYGIYAGITSGIISNNLVSSFILNGGLNNTTMNFYGVYASPAASTTIENNFVGGYGDYNGIIQYSNSIGNNFQSLYGIFSTSTVTLRNNTVSHLYNHAKPASFASGYSVVGISVNNSLVCSNNIIHDLYSEISYTGSYGLSLIGLQCFANGGEVRGNSIYSLYNTNPTTNAGVVGMYYEGKNNYEAADRNLIHSLVSNSPSTGVTGIWMKGTASALYNNMIRLGFDTLGNSVSDVGGINGILLDPSNTFAKVFHNTIYIGGNTYISGGSSALLSNPPPSSQGRIIENNIFYNERSYTGNSFSGSHTGVYYGVAFLNQTGLTLDYNTYYTPGNGGNVGQYLSTVYPNLSSWQTATGKDLHSNYGLPCLKNPTSGFPDLHLDFCFGLPNPTDGTGISVFEVPVDYDGETRAGLTPVDKGADAATLVTSFTLGNYPDMTIASGQNTVVVPTAAPTGGVLKLYVGTNQYFEGTITADAVTGNVRITNAQPAGDYIVTVSTGLVTKTFTLHVLKPNCSTAAFNTINANFSLPSSTKLFEVGDFNKDGFQDVVLTVSGTDSAALLLGDGSGNFVSSTVINLDNNAFTISRNGLDAADFNQDGNLDFAVAGIGTHKIYLKFGDGNGNFPQTKTILVPVNSFFFKVDDLNNDLIPDIIYGESPSQNNARILLGDGTGNFLNNGTVSFSTNLYNVETADLNNDGKKDLIGNFLNSSTMEYKVGNGLGSFSGGGTISTAFGQTIFYTTGDFNKDSKIDLAIMDFNSKIAIKLGDGTGNFIDKPLLNFTGFANEIKSGDFNGDGNPDLVVSGGNGLLIYTGDGLGGFSASTLFEEDSSATLTLKIADLNNDSLLDIVASTVNRPLLINLGIEKKLKVYGQTTEITNGSNVISTLNNTDFGNVPVSGFALKQFDIKNYGAGQLSISSVSVSGLNASEFSIPGLILPYSIPGGNALSIGVKLSPLSAGTKSAKITIQFTGCTPGTFTFDIGGNAGTPALGDYFNTTLVTNSQQHITPSAAPQFSPVISLFTTPHFDGNISIDAVTGMIYISNARHTGNYVVKVQSGTIIKTFNISVTNPNCNQVIYSLEPYIQSNTSPYLNAIGDFNQDGFQDMAVTSNFQAEVAILLNNHLGTLVNHIKIPIASNMGDILVGDFNSDGIEDLLATCPANNSVAVLIGNGIGEFIANNSVPTGQLPKSVALGDFNADGIDDFVTSNYNSNSASVRYGNGNGGFFGNLEITVGTNPYKVIVSDFNGDGKDDFAVSNYNSSTVSVELNNGAGGFTSATSFSTPGNPDGITAGDFNHDGKVDLAVINHNTSYTISVKLGNGVGGFTGSLELPTLSSNASQLSAGDLNGDGFIDIIGGVGNDTTIAIYLSKGNGSFNSQVNVSADNAPTYDAVHGFAIGDINYDSIPDIVSCSNYIHVLKGEIHGVRVSANANPITNGGIITSTNNNTDFGLVPTAYSTSRSFTIQNDGAAPLTINSFSFTGSNVSDFTASGFTLPYTIPGQSSAAFSVNCNASTTGVKTATVHVNYNECGNLDYNFAVQSTVATPVLGAYSTQSVVSGGDSIAAPSAAPVNVTELYVSTNPAFDGILNVDPLTGIVRITNAKHAGNYVVSVRAGNVVQSFSLSVLKPECGGTNFSTTSISKPSHYQPYYPTVGDFNNDGKQDYLIVENVYPAKIEINLGNGTGTFVVSDNVIVPDGVVSPRIADFNGDGNQDIVYTNPSLNKVGILLGDGQGHFAGNYLNQVGFVPYLIETSDFNDDGKVDIAVTNLNSNSVSIRLGDGNGSFYGSNELTGITQPSAIGSGDFNNDGKADLLVGSRVDGRVYIFIGTGNGTFLAPTSIVIASPSDFEVGDFNNDSKLDFICSNNNVVTLELGNGLGGFSLGSNTTVTFYSDIVRTGDFNGDGNLDFLSAITTSITNIVTIRFGTGTGSFTGSSDISLPHLSLGLAIGDFNGDRFEDFIASGYPSSNYSYEVSVHLGSGTEIDLTGNTQNIIDGSVSVSASNNTNFGNQAINTSSVKSFVIDNNGSQPLIISGINITGANPSDFSVSGISFPLTIPVNGFALFNLTFLPTVTAIRNATIHINNNDCNESDFDFAVRGTGTCVIPVFTSCPTTQTVTPISGQCRVAVTYNAAADGNPSPTLSYTFTGATSGTGTGTGSGALFNLGTSHVTITATNCSSITCSFDVIVTGTINDGNGCTIDACNSTSGLITHTPVNINDNNACTDDACESASGNITHTPVNVDDNNACTADACNTQTGQITHTTLNTNDNNACTTDGCDSNTGVFHNPVTIDDGNACTMDGCNTTTGIFHNPVNTNDNNACTTDGCDSSTGIFHNPVTTDDGNACTTDGCITSTGVFHNPVNTNDNNACTTDGCDSNTGVFHNAVETDDHNACTDDGCNTLTGVFHNAISTDDHNACTTDGCNTTTGAFHDPVSVDDGNACTTDGCDSNTGIYHTPVDPDDGNACTTDYCDSMVGVQNNIIEYDDNNACTLDGCDTVTGIYHHPIDPDDHNACTTDGCDTATGVYHNDVDIDDHNACTIDGCDSQNGIFHIAVFIDDGNACTIDACNTETGEITHMDDSPTVSITIDPIKCYGETGCVTVTATGGTPPYFGLDTYCGYSAGTYYLDVSDSKGCMITKEVTFEEPPKFNVSISSTPATCAGNDGTASVDASGGVAPYSYLWSPGGEITSGISDLSQGDYTCTATDNKGCEVTLTTTVSGGAGFPDSPGAIQGAAGACRKESGLIYCISPVANADYYEWTIPSGVTINGQSNGPCITLTFTSKFKGGFVCVKAHNACGASQSSCMNITYLTKKPNTPGSITGPATICPNATATYTTPLILNATSYQWTANGGVVIISGQGTNTITVRTPSNYVKTDIKVKATNCKGASGQRTRKITKSTTCKTAAQQSTFNNQQPTTNLQVFPNPATNFITVSFESTRPQDVDLLLIDLLGNIIQGRKINAIEGKNSLLMDLSDVSKGIYTITLIDKDKTTTVLKLILN